MHLICHGSFILLETDFEMRHSYLNERLCLERDKLQTSDLSADGIVKQQEQNTAIMPAEMPATK